MDSPPPNPRVTSLLAAGLVLLASCGGGSGGTAGPGADLTGTVREVTKSTPVAGATVNLGSHQATTAESSLATVRLAAQFDSVYAAVGIHPNSAAQATPGDWDRVVELIHEPRVVALGETGLDRHWDFTPFAVQEDFFARHLALSRRTRLPVVIHCREAEADILRMLREDYERSGPVRGVLHSYCGPWEVAEAALAMVVTC